MRKNLEVRFLRPAEADISEAVNFLLEQNVPAAEKFLRKIDKAVSKIRRFPMLGKRLDEKFISKQIRFVVIVEYLLFYSIEEETILIHRIIHSARDYKQLL